MKDLFLKKIIIGIAGIFAVSLYAPSAYSQTVPCLESCLNTSTEFFVCCGNFDTQGFPCTVEEYCRDLCACGNGSIDTTCSVTEQCDDGNNASGDGCDQGCRGECGNGVIDGNETCDDGNTEPGDGCNQFCRTEEVVFTAPPLPPLTYKGQQFFDYTAVYKLAVDDFKIKPSDPVDVVVKNVSFTSGIADMKVSVMGKQAIAIHHAHLIDLLEHNLTLPDNETVVFSYNPICSNPKNVAFFGTFGKGCRETARTVWESPAQACAESMGCCVWRTGDPIPSTPGGIKDFLCKAPPTAPSTNTITGDGLY